MFSVVQETKKNLEKNWNVKIFESIDSTNNFARDHLGEWKTRTLLLAAHQTHGRGRGQNEWFDEGKDRQFLGSFIIPLPASQLIDPRWTLALGYFVFEALKKAWPDFSFSIKAPNDIFLNDKKVGGILVEASQWGENSILIFGLGLNVFSHPQLREDTATDLRDVDEKTWRIFNFSLSERLENFESFINPPLWLANISSNLRIALNLNPHHRDNPIQKIHDDGSLELRQGYLDWLQL